MPCSEPAEVVVCGCVAAGEPYDFLHIGESVAVAMCAGCAAAAKQLFDIEDEYREENLMSEFYEKLVFNTRAKTICRNCARKLGVPDRTPNGESEWHRPVN